MSVYATLDTDTQIQLASNQGWGNFARWVDVLDHEEYPGLVHLREHGWDQDLDDLDSELRTALEKEAFPDKDVKGTAQLLLGLLGEDKEAEVIVVSGGMGPEQESGQ